MQDWVLNPLLKQVPGVTDVTGYGGTVKQYQVLIDTRLLKQYNVTMKQVEEAIARANSNVGGDIMTMGTQSHNVRVVGLLGEGIDPLEPANVAHASAIESAKLDDIRDVVVDTAGDGTPIYVRQVAQVVVGYKPRQGIVGEGSHNDVVEGIVLMRKYEKSLPHRRGGRRQAQRDRGGKSLATGDARRSFQPADRPGPCDDRERPA